MSAGESSDSSTAAAISHPPAGQANNQLRGSIDIVGRIEGEEAKAGRGGAIDVGGCFEMIGIGTLRAFISGGGRALKASPITCSGERRGAGHFADRLLGEDRQNSAARFAQGRDMPGRCDAEPIAEAEAGL